VVAGQRPALSGARMNDPPFLLRRTMR